MSSLVQELQRDALNHQIGVTELLQKALVVARKLRQAEFADWIRLELEGYQKGRDVPDYRIVHGSPKVFNPYRGYQPLYCADIDMTKALSKMHFNQPIGEIQYALRDVEPGGSFQVSYSPGIAAKLRNAMDFGLEPSLQVDASQFQKILDAVRKAILEWSLSLEEQGITGEDMGFSRDEQQKAAGPVFNVQNYISSNENSQIQIHATESVQSMTAPAFDLGALEELIAAARRAGDMGLTRDSQAEMEAELQTLEAQASSPKPKVSIIRESLGSITHVLEGAGGNLVASGILALIGKVFGAS